MNRLLCFLISFAFFIPASHSQYAKPEFAIYSNGLIYDENDIKTLRFIVDSLNLRFRTCEMKTQFYSLPQANVINIKFFSVSNDLKDIIAEIEKEVSVKELLDKFPSYFMSIDSNLLLIESNKYKGKTYYLEGTPAKGYTDVYISDKDQQKGLMDKWVYYYDKKTNYNTGYSLSCRFFYQSWKQSVIPGEYSKLIQYVDCMIDTNASVFLTDKYTHWFDDKPTYSNQKDIVDYIDKKLRDKKNNEADTFLNTRRIEYAILHLKADKKFRTLLAAAIDAYAANKIPNIHLERIANECGMYDKALLMMRCNRVAGLCSRDNTPRLQARGIASLAARTHSWDIFLRAHLDIMNDRFDRVSDGSYAWNGRKTYLKELEELNLDIVDLMLGLALRAHNTSDNHYYGTVWRLGWALTESKERYRFEQKALAILKDDRLDEFNRGLIFMLYSTYLRYLDKTESSRKIKDFKLAAATFPSFIRDAILNLKE